MLVIRIGHHSETDGSFVDCSPNHLHNSDARCLEQADGSIRKLRKRGEGGSRLLIGTVARPIDGPLVLATQMLTIHCRLFVFGQGSGYWSTCPGESICFTEAILLDLRIVWSWGAQGEGCQEGILWGMVLCWEFRAIYGWMCRVTHGLGYGNTERWGKCAKISSLSSLVCFLRLEFSKFWMIAVLY